MRNTGVFALKMITVSSGCLSAPLLPHQRGSGVQSAPIRVSLRFQRGKVSLLYDSQSKNKDAGVSEWVSQYEKTHLSYKAQRRGGGSEVGGQGVKACLSL